MKKILKTTFALTMALGMGLGAAGCSHKVSDLQMEYKGKWGLNVTAYTALDGTKRYDVEGKYGKYVVFSTPAVGEAAKMYYLLDLEKGVVLHTSVNKIFSIDEGMFYSVNANGAYTLYLPASMATYEVEKAKISDNVFVDEANNVRTYINVKGEVESVHNPFVKILCYGDSYVEMGSKYVQPISDSGVYNDEEGSEYPCFQVFDKNGKYERTVSALSRMGVATDEKLGGMWYIDDTVYLQTTRQLPDTEDDYDYSVDTVKYDLTTYTYDVEKDKVQVWDEFDYVVTYYTTINEKAALVYAQKVENKKLSKAYASYALDKKGELYVDIQALVPGAVWYHSVGEYVYLIDALNEVHVFKGNKKIGVFPSETNFINGYICSYDPLQKTLRLHHVEDGYAYTEAKNVAAYPKFINGNTVVYLTENAATNASEICIFNTETGSTSVKALAAAQQVSMQDTYAVVYNENGTRDLYFYATGETIEGLNEYETVGTFSLKGKEMTLIYTQKGEVGTYYMIAETYPVA